MSTPYVIEPCDWERLHISVVGVGDWGCDVLKGILRQRLPYALTLALPTKELDSYCRHPAARVLPLSENSHYENACRYLNHSDLNIFIVSSKAHTDIAVVHELLKTIEAVHTSKYFIITDELLEQPARLYQSPTEPPLTILYLDSADKEHMNKLVSSYLTTIINIMYNHRLKGVEYYELATFTGDQQYKLASTQSVEIEIDRLHELPELLCNVTDPATKRSLICIQYSSSFDVMLVDENIRNKYAFPVFVLYVPAKNVSNTFDVTVINFE